MSELISLKITPQGIGHMLADRNWAVPRYQRAYKWEEKQVSDLLTDVETALQENQSEYFVGSVVVARTDPDRPEIVDGQQRLATTTILIAAIRDYFLIDTDDRQGAEIIEKYLFERDLKSRELLPRLKLSNADNDFFLHKILDPPSETRDNLKPERDSHRRLVRAQELARTYVEGLVKGAASPQDKLDERITFLKTKTLIILVEVPSHQNAFTIFETLNDRGITLAIADLLKNYLFHRAGVARIDEVQQRWIEMFTTIESAADEETVKDFIRHQWSSMHGLTRERQLYQAIKKRITAPNQAVQYAGELSRDANLFAALQNNTHEFWKGYGTSSRQHVFRIRELGMERITPLLLAVLASFPKTEIQRSLKMVVCWGVRILVAGGVPGALETKYSDVAGAIRRKTIKTASQLFNAMKEVIPGDLDFKKAFANAKVPRAALARYYLQVLEREVLGQAEPEFIPNPDESEINLEHVLPQNPEDGTWSQFRDEDRVAYTNRLGNLALLQRSENCGSGNDEFIVKKANLAASSYQLTSQIGFCADWTSEYIEARQSALAELAVEAWPLK